MCIYNIKMLFIRNSEAVTAVSKTKYLIDFLQEKKCSKRLTLFCFFATCELYIKADYLLFKLFNQHLNLFYCSLALM